MTSRDIVIRAEGLGKKYVIGHNAERESYVALRDVIARNARNFGRSALDLLRGRPNVAGDEIEDFWALKNVNFEIGRGEVVGVVGRNGAGKSTLLKVLSRITEPTEGRIEMRGRVASLLEVGTGFHPELTGRENIFLNGAVLGMSRAEVRSKFDQIVAFSEVERFLDTPVKRYSSGMYVRLAFGVAAHLEPEILIIDEVLAVGDAEFQKKCLGKMGEVASHGRTVIFVSHNMAAVRALCPRSLLMNQGRLIATGSTSDVLTQYADLARSSGTRFDQPSRASGLQIGMSIDRANTAYTRGPSRLTITIDCAKEQDLREFAVIIATPSGVRVALLDMRENNALPMALPVGSTTIQVKIDDWNLPEGRYVLGAYLISSKFEGDLESIAEMDIIDDPDLAKTYIPYGVEHRGYCVPSVSHIGIGASDDVD